MLKFKSWIDFNEGCAAFHPTDDNIVFLFGGINGDGYRKKNAFKYHIDDQTHHDELNWHFICYFFPTFNRTCTRF